MKARKKSGTVSRITPAFRPWDRFILMSGLWMGFMFLILAGGRLVAETVLPAGSLPSFDFSHMTPQSIAGLLIWAAGILGGGVKLETWLEHLVMDHISSPALKSMVPTILSLVGWTITGLAAGMSWPQIISGALATDALATRIHASTSGTQSAAVIAAAPALQ